MAKLEENPYYQKALDYIQHTDLNSLEYGTHEIDGKNLYVIVKEFELKKPEEAVFEVHDHYIDIQIPINGDEGFGICPRSELKQPLGEYNAEKDKYKFSDPVKEIVTVKAGDQIAFQPHEGHAPLIGEGKVKVATFKVRIP